MWIKPNRGAHHTFFELSLGLIFIQFTWNKKKLFTPFFLRFDLM
jgi:hypothetical protein